MSHFAWHLPFSATLEVISPSTGHWHNLTVLHLVCFALSHPNLPTSLLNMNALVGSCESQVFYIWDEGMAETLTDWILIDLRPFSVLQLSWDFSVCRQSRLLCRLIYCNFEVFRFILILEKHMIGSPHCLCYKISVLSVSLHSPIVSHFG